MKHNLKEVFSHTARVAAGLIASAALVLFTAGAGVTALPVHAAGGVEMSTSYPGVSVKPGANQSFSLDFTNNSGEGQLINLTASGLPEGWEGHFEGNGSEISAVYAKAGDNNSLASYAVSIPDDAKKGTYHITLKGGASTLQLTFNVTDEETGTSGLTVDQEQQQGPNGTTFTFNVTLSNSTASAQTYNLSAQAPTGWGVTFRPSGASADASSIDVDAHGSQQIAVTVTPADGSDATDYTIPVSAVSGSENLQTNITVTITGTYSLDVTTSDETLSFNANSGHEKKVTLNVTNTGNIELDNVKLSASAPSSWETSFSESAIASIAPGETQSVTMFVTPSNNSVSGDYQMSVTASCDNASKNAAFRVTVRTSTKWGVVGVVIIAAIIAGLAYVFHKFGRH